MRTEYILEIIELMSHKEKEMKDILLKEATRDELIDELRKRESISFAKINNGEGATLESVSGRYSFEDEIWIFAIKPNHTNKTFGGVLDRYKINEL